MITYIALFRGINVSGKNIIKMDYLKSIFIDLGFENVKTYIQSGNVIFNSKTNKSEFEISQQIQEVIYKILNLEIPILVFKPTFLKEVIENIPFKNFETKNMYLTFTSEILDITNQEDIFNKKNENELIAFSEKVIYLNSDCYGKTKLSNTFLEKKLKVICTTRNLNTCEKILSLSL